MSVFFTGCSTKDISKPQNIEETVTQYTYEKNSEEETEDDRDFEEIFNDVLYYTVASFNNDSHFYDTNEITYDDTIWNGLDRITFRISNVKAYKTKDLDSLEYFSTSKVMKEAIMYEELNEGWTSENSSFVVISFTVCNMSDKRANFNEMYRLCRRVELSDLDISDKEKEFIKSLVENDSRCSDKKLESVNHNEDCYIKTTGEKLSDTMLLSTVLEPQTEYDFVICSRVSDDILMNNDIYLDITNQSEYEVDEKLTKKYGKEIWFPKENVNVKYIKLDIQDSIQ